MADLSPVLTSGEVLKAVRKLEGHDLHINTLAYWAKAGIATPSVRWDRKRGRYHGRLYNMADLARVRLVVRLTRGEARVSMPKARNILTSVEDKLPELLKRKTKAVLHVDGWRGVIVLRPGHADVELPTGQTVLPLASVIEGNAETARKVIAG